MEIEGTASAMAPADTGLPTSLRELKEALLLSYLQCSERGLVYSANWFERERGH